MFASDKEEAYTASRSKDHVILMAMRMLCLSVMVALLTVHVRSVRVFRWEQTVSGGLLVTYIIVIVGLALCAGIENCGARVLQLGVCSINGMKVLTMAAIVAVLRIHYRCLMMLRWRNSATGIVLIVNIAAMSGLTYLVAMDQCGLNEFKTYFCAVGGALLAVNALSIWRRWRRAGDMTRVVAELLGAMGVPIRRQVLIKAILSAAAAILMLLDLAWILLHSKNVNLKKL